MMRKLARLVMVLGLDATVVAWAAGASAPAEAPRKVPTARGSPAGCTRAAGPCHLPLLMPSAEVAVPLLRRRRPRRTGF